MAHPTVTINGPALRAIRTRSGVSCSALARAVGVDVSFLARVERGEKHGVGRETWERIADHLRVDGRALLVDPFGRVTQVTSQEVATGLRLATSGLYGHACSTRSTPAA